MSKPIRFTDLINHVSPSHNRIARVIMSILVMEHKLAHPEEQSEYFRWAARNNESQLGGMERAYEGIREEFNEWTVDGLISHIDKAKKELREEVPGTHPRIIRAFRQSALLSRIDKYEDFLQLRSITSSLPSWNELKKDPELISEILDAG